MNTQTFFNTLKRNSDKALLFEYEPDKFVKANYHITEIKNHTIESVDCGGSSNSWQETIVQLWENPIEIGKRSHLTTTKAAAIFKKVDAIKPLLLETTIKFEYGNKSFHTANLPVETIIENDKSIIVKLHADVTQCKANDTCCASNENDEQTSSKSEKTAICC